MRDSLAAEVEKSRFTPVRFREGYDMSDVDLFLDVLCELLRSGEPVGDFIASARFSRVKWREGYAIDEVDALLQRVAATA